MRILITPLIQNIQSSTAYYLSMNLAYLFVTQGHTVAISADKDNNFHHVSLYPAPTCKKARSLKKLSKRNYEEWLYASGASSEKYLEEDYACISDCIRKFHPDLIITMDRLTSIFLSRKRNIRCWTIVHSDMYKNTYFDSDCMLGINKVLKNHNLEQEFNIRNIFSKCERRIGFGPIEVQPFNPKDDITRIGVSSIYPPHTVRTNRVCIFFQDIDQKPTQLKKMIQDAFHGAPYSVYAWFKGCRPETIDNIHFLQNTKAELLPGSIACIHDGNDYFTNQCLARGIQQVIVTNHDYIRNSNALAAERNKFGLAIYEDELTMSRLYEQYRLLLSDDKYYYYTQAMKKITLDEGDLTQLLQYL
jgi:hypothetical protein